MKEVLRKIDRFQIEIYLINITLLCYLSRTAIPPSKLPFLLLYICILIYSLLVHRKKFISSLGEYARNYYLLLILATILIISFFFSDKLYLVIFKDIINALILISLFFIMTLFVLTKNDFKIFFNSFINLVIYFALGISLYFLGDLFSIFSTNDVYSSYGVSSNSISGTLPIDYNFALLLVFFGIIGIFYFQSKNISRTKRIIFNLILIIYSLNIFFSGSRRGIITFGFIVIFLAISQVLIRFKNINILNRIKSSSFYFLLSLIGLGLFTWFITFNTSYEFKNKTLKLIGSKDLFATKDKITAKLFRCYTIFNRTIIYPDFYNIIWTPAFYPKDPDSVWGTRKHKTIFPLSGQNVEIVPARSKGYFMDHTCNANSWDGNAYSFTGIGFNEVDEKKSIIASVFCYVSEDFDGTWVRLSAEGAVKGNLEHEYDLKNKGVWQKLTLNVNCTKGLAVVYLYFAKFAATDFSSLHGHVIFAYPVVEVSTSGDSLLDNSSFINQTFDIHRTTTFLESPELMGVSIFNFEYPLNLMRQISNDKDPIRKLASKFISEDTTYHGYKQELYVDSLSNNLAGVRIMRWRFAGQIYLKEYNWKEKIFGGGFNFLNWFGYYFEKDKKISDHPHNPFLSILLYSGLLGLILYIYLIYKAISYYFVFFSEYKVLSICSFITAFFSFFSGGSPFDPPIMGFFVIMPFFIHHIHTRQF